MTTRARAGAHRAPVRARWAVPLGVACAAVVVVTLAGAPRQHHVSRIDAAGSLRPQADLALPSAIGSAPAAPVHSVAPAPPPIPVVATPTSLTLPSIHVRADVVPVGVSATAGGAASLEVPPLTQVGWYRFGARPGEPGAAVLVGHVDGDGRTGVFWLLRDLAPGDPVDVGYADGSHRRFVVAGRAQIAKTALPPDLFSRQGPPRLTLITCGGAFAQATGHYVDNVVVVATSGS